MKFGILHKNIQRDLIEITGLFRTNDYLMKYMFLLLYSYINSLSFHESNSVPHILLDTRKPLFNKRNGYIIVRVYAE